MSIIGEKIHELRKSKGYTLSDLADAIGTSRQTIHRYENGIIANIPADKIEALARALDTRPSHLLGWENGPSDVVSSERDERTGEAPDGEIRHVAEDDSMSGDRIYRGDTVIVSTSLKEENSDIVLIEKNGEKLIRRIYFSESGETVFSASSPNCKPIITDMKNSDVKILGVAVGLIVKLRRNI